MHGGNMTTKAKYTNRSSESWVLTVTQNARSKHPMVSERVHANLEQLLKVQISDRKLTGTKLREVAAQLLAEQEIQQPVSEEEHEDQIT